MTTPIPRRRRLGTAGESYARRYLEARGYRFVTAQWRGAGCELDLVMWHGDELVFVEVKTRRGESHGRAAESVTTRQAKALIRGAEAYVQVLNAAGDPEPVWRIDLVAVTLESSGRVADVTHIENAFVIDV